jgi:hypothetical protein
VRAEDQEAGPVGVPGQWPCGGQRGRRRGAAASAGATSAPAALAPISGKSPQYREIPISVYSDIDYISEPMSLKIDAGIGIF